MAKFPRSNRKQYQIQRAGAVWQVWGFHRGVWKILAEADSRKEAKKFVQEQMKYYKFFREYQKGVKI